LSGGRKMVFGLKDRSITAQGKAQRRPGTRIPPTNCRPEGARENARRININNMALDIYNINTGEHLFTLNDEQYDLFLNVFEHYYQRSGRYIDQYGNLTMGIPQQKELFESVIHCLCPDNDRTKQQIHAEFQKLLNHCICKNIVIRLLGD